MTTETDLAPGETPEEEQGTEALVKALRAQREDNKVLRRQGSLKDVFLKYPKSGLEEADFEGLTPDKFEARADSLVKRFGQPVNEEPETEPTPTSQPEEEAFARMAKATEPAKTPSPGGAAKMDRDEAFALRARDPAKYEALRAAGQIDLGGNFVDRGGSNLWKPS